jgi:hypothetical protein
VRYLLALLLGLCAGVALADEPTDSVIRDSLGMFSKKAVERATQQIRSLRDAYKIDLVIETTKDMPAESEEERKAWWKTRARNETMNRWATNRAADLRDNQRFDGIYIVIVDGGFGKRDVRVVGMPASRSAEVSWVKREHLRKLLLKGVFKASEDRDRALREVVETFRAQMHQIKQADPSPLSIEAAVFVVGVGVVVWMVLMIVRWRMNIRSTPTDPEPVAIYQPAMLGTLFGVPAAFWVNDELFRVIPPEVPPVDSSESDSFTLPPDDAPPSDNIMPAPGIQTSSPSVRQDREQPPTAV